MTTEVPQHVRGLPLLLTCCRGKLCNSLQLSLRRGRLRHLGHRRLGLGLQRRQQRRGRLVVHLCGTPHSVGFSGHGAAELAKPCSSRGRYGTKPAVHISNIKGTVEVLCGGWPEPQKTAQGGSERQAAAAVYMPGAGATASFSSSAAATGASLTGSAAGAASTAAFSSSTCIAGAGSAAAASLLAAASSSSRDASCAGCCSAAGATAAGSAALSSASSGAGASCRGSTPNLRTAWVWNSVVQRM